MSVGTDLRPMPMILSDSAMESRKKIHQIKLIFHIPILVDLGRQQREERETHRERKNIRQKKERNAPPPCCSWLVYASLAGA